MRIIFRRFVFRNAAASSGLTYGSKAFRFMFMPLQTPKMPFRHGVRLGTSEDIHRPASPDRKSTRLNSSHLGISYAVFCLKKKKTPHTLHRRRHTTFSLWHDRRRPSAA